MRGAIVIAQLVLVAIVTANASAQDRRSDEPRVHGTVESTTVVAGDRIVFTIEVQNAELDAVEISDPPVTSGLVALHRRPSVSRSIDIVDRRLTSTVRYRYVYQAISEGTARIDEVEVQVSGRAHTTDSITLTVVADRIVAESMRELPAMQTEDVFIQGTLSSESAFVHEQLIVEYRLFYREGVQLRQSRMAGSWDTPGFWREDMDVDLRPTPDRRIVNGLHFSSILLKRAALYPTRDGRLRVEPFRIESEVRGRGGDPRDPFAAYRNRFRNVEISSNAIEIDVASVPSPAPPSFNGAVGRFDVRTNVEGHVGSINLNTGDPLRVSVEIRGRGNLPLIAAPELQLPEQFDRFATTDQTEVDVSGARPSGTRSFTYTAVPAEPGVYVLPGVEFAYFDPDVREYVTVGLDTFVVQVEGEPLVAGSGGGGNEIIRSIGTVSMAPVPLYRQPWAYVPLGIPLAAWLLLPGVARLRRRRTSDAVTRATREASKSVNRELRRLRGHNPARIEQPLHRLLDSDEVRSIIPSSRDELLAALEEARFAPLDARALMLRRVLDRLERELISSER
jgi:hypothetical protein